MVKHWKEALYKEQNGETLEGNYLRRKDRIRRLTKVLKFIDKKFGYYAFSPDSKVLEIGCNMALNLRIMKSIYDCHVTGIDINAEAIGKCKEYFEDSDDFRIASLLDPDVLSQYDDGHFDLGFSTAVLMHIPISKSKERLISEFIRVCKQFIICEPFRRKGPRMVEHDNGWCATFEDYCNYSDQIVRFEGFTAQPEHYIYYKKRDTDEQEGSSDNTSESGI